MTLNNIEISAAGSLLELMKPSQKRGRDQATFLAPAAKKRALDAALVREAMLYDLYRQQQQQQQRRQVLNFHPQRYGLVAGRPLALQDPRLAARLGFLPGYQAVVRPHALLQQRIFPSRPVPVQVTMSPPMTSQRFHTEVHPISPQAADDGNSVQTSSTSEASVEDKGDETRSSEPGTDDCTTPIVPTDDDVLIGTGRTCSSHTGNKRFHREIYDCCDEYFQADYKKGIVDRVIAGVQSRGGRFLTKKNGSWVLVDDKDRLERNSRKSFHMAKKQRAKEATQPETQKTPAPRPGKVGEQVACYIEQRGSFCMGNIKKVGSGGQRLVEFNKDSNLGCQWVDMDNEDVKILSR